MVDSTSASSGEITSSRSASVLDGVTCNSGISCPLSGSRYWIRLWCDSSVSSSIRTPGVAQHLHHRPGPEAAVFVEGQVAAPPAVGGFGPDATGGLGLHHRAAQRLARSGEYLTRFAPFGGR